MSKPYLYYLLYYSRRAEMFVSLLRYISYGNFHLLQRILRISKCVK